MYVHVCMYVHVTMYMYVTMHVCTCMYVHVCNYVHVCMQICIPDIVLIAMQCNILQITITFKILLLLLIPPKSV